MKCKKCGKPLEENTDGMPQFCQGHSIWDEPKKDEKKEPKK